MVRNKDLIRLNSQDRGLRVQDYGLWRQDYGLRMQGYSLRGQEVHAPTELRALGFDR